jgi:hypothetical protein
MLSLLAIWRLPVVEHNKSKVAMTSGLALDASGLATREDLAALQRVRTCESVHCLFRMLISIASGCPLTANGPPMVKKGSKCGCLGCPTGPNKRGRVPSGHSMKRLTMQ